MRIIAGRWKGTKLMAPVGQKTRPTSDRVKESIFSILGYRIQEARVLDLCAGTGSLGLEALSRGAYYAVFIEKNDKAWDVVRENCHKVHADSDVRVVRGDVLRYIADWDPMQGTFSLIFFDPPYRSGLYQPVLEAIDKSALLRKGGTVVVEYDIDMALEDAYETLALADTRRYGDTQISFFIRQKEGAPCQ